MKRRDFFIALATLVIGVVTINEVASAHGIPGSWGSLAGDARGSQCVGVTQDRWGSTSYGGKCLREFCNCKRFEGPQRLCYNCGHPYSAHD